MAPSGRTPTLAIALLGKGKGEGAMGGGEDDKAYSVSDKDIEAVLTDAKFSPEQAKAIRVACQMAYRAAESGDE